MATVSHAGLPTRSGRQTASLLLHSQSGQACRMATDLTKKVSLQMCPTLNRTLFHPLGEFRTHRTDSLKSFHFCLCVSGGQKGTSDSLELELHVVVSHLMWVLGTGLWSFARTVCAPNPLSHFFRTQEMILLFLNLFPFWMVLRCLCAKCSGYTLIAVVKYHDRLERWFSG